MQQFNSLRYFALFFSLLISVISARKVKFSLISFGTDVNVKIGSSNYPLTKVDKETPLFQATISVADSEIT